MKPVVSLMNILQTKIGIVFAFFVPLVFMIIWMTGYDDATTRVNQLHVGLVNEDSAAQSAAIGEKIAASMPFQIIESASRDEAMKQLDDGGLDMVIVLPAHLTDAADGSKLTYYVNDRNSELVKGIMEGLANQITGLVNHQVTPEAAELPIQTELVKTNAISNFRTSMLPMILGFIPYIAMMTMNIQFNIASMMMKREHRKWDIFFGRQVVLAGVAVIVPLVLSLVAKLFTSVDSSFWQLWGFEILVFASCICVTQLAFTLFGNAGPLFNVFLIPIQLMTAGNIIAASMLTPLYRHLGSFLPVPNGVNGAMHLVYGGGSIASYAWNLVFIALVSWGLTVLRLSLSKEAAVPQTARAAV